MIARGDPGLPRTLSLPFTPKSCGGTSRAWSYRGWTRIVGEIAKAIGKPASDVQYLLGKMVVAGEAEKSKHGLYTLPSES